MKNEPVLVDARSKLYCNCCRKELEKAKYNDSFFYYCRKCEKYMLCETGGIIRKI